ncbi:MAG: nucleotidyltransferase family protein [Candidatus Omnitrophica bacterium]|nr:nucleotidyltransferase family protein [Candidatus Omnitrophota bacterium]
MLTKNDIVKIVQENMEEIKGYGIKKIGIFGSMAVGSQTEQSDIDFLIEFHKHKKAFDNYMGLKFFLEELFNRKVDLVIEGTLKSRIKDSVLKEVSYA